MNRVAMKSFINILVVAVCIGSLAFHIVEQSLSTDNNLGSYELAMDGGETHDQTDHSEDCLLLSLGNCSSSLNLLKSIFLTAALHPNLPVFLPQLPPPK
jgi:hypothetical protein